MEYIPIIDSSNDIVTQSLPKGGLSLSLKIVEQQGLKSVRKHISINTPDYESIKKELETLIKMRDRRVLILKGYSIIGNSLYIYTEYCPEGDLSQLISRKRREHTLFDEKVFLNYNNIFIIDYIDVY